MKRFQRTIEDFTCENCGKPVQGNGYTNHCPSCLWSKHVDLNPGDRASNCHGLMQPLQVSFSKGEPVIHHRCTVCGHEKKNKKAVADSMDSLLAIMSSPGVS